MVTLTANLHQEPLCNFPLQKQCLLTWVQLKGTIPDTRYVLIKNVRRSAKGAGSGTD